MFPPGSKLTIVLPCFPECFPKVQDFGSSGRMDLKESTLAFLTDHCQCGDKYVEDHLGCKS